MVKRGDSSKKGNMERGENSLDVKDESDDEMDESDEGTLEISSFYDGGIYDRNSPETMSTLSIIENSGRRRVKCPGSMRTIHDNTSPGYGWLLPGWLAEERIMPSGRIYRFYYDPSGCFYYTLNEALDKLKELGFIVIS
ncbi:hypothetical protein JCGZ_01457 [Jatropha curcas]|uniref:MBD domain-containing protein n=1 Tax=Jatropha curcas TaxID=180498 RepID=A0A067L965_JATCU|nr:uncharacterized protein LOC105647670 [Jatropha curcas]KDP44957.1 hypothetical protein JCGZ_01457 [Jatropha curcas]